MVVEGETPIRIMAVVEETAQLTKADKEAMEDMVKTLLTITTTTTTTFLSSEVRIIDISFNMTILPIHVAPEF